jgi:hypothetical protein
MEDIKAFQDTLLAPMNAFAAYMSAMGKTASELQAKARDSMVQSIANFQSQRSSFQDNVEKIHQFEEQAWEQGSKEVAQAWANFDNLVNDATARFDSERDAYIARADEQLSSWTQYVEHYSQQAVKFFDEQSEKFTNVADEWRAAQEDSLNRFRDLGTANLERWRAVTARQSASAAQTAAKPTQETQKKKASAASAA